MFRLTLLVGAILGASYLGETVTALASYQDYAIAILLVVLLRPWIVNQFE